ncbi:YhcN/YlaJ family sporulation lipoprotein [Bacillus sp. WLY-B-L8]|uniref:YhcN/YlaJ family sporulation lipoprotein n=1 Tax=Bacillus multifaciens TaxID=3068506 RepID=UPI0027417DC9|nr:YhcN/YlaJ family sporulation lipoprotein [Bacillus sp. WLY-B-L8]MDP7979684.1 YhcN/YlaJ family sporulation lipoprotein [Bacillus sp. WLY-B-L8]HDX9590025.1 YhcN/YlaJ family sporulation lipoprotein [Bacillus pseudomycoides]
MRKFRIITLLFLLFFSFLSGCNSPLDKKVKKEASEKEEHQTNKKDTPLKNVSMENIDQSIANQAKDQIFNMEEVIDVKAVNFNNELYVAAKPEHHERFQLKKLKKEMKQTLEKTYPNFKIYVSMDKKIFMLLDKLETKIKNKEADKKEIKKQLKVVKEEMHSDI